MPGGLSPGSKQIFPGIFSRHAQAYARRHREIARRHDESTRERLLELVAPRPGERALDLACGPGNLTRRLAAAVAPGGSVIGVDLAPGMLEVARTDARAAGLEIEFELMDVEELRFPDQAFDLVVCGHGYQFVPDLRQALSEARRVLRPGGRLGASVPASVLDPARSDAAVWRLAAERLPDLPQPPDQEQTRRTVGDLGAWRALALGIGFAEAQAEAVEETSNWRNARDLVEQSMGWWSLAVRLEALTEPQRQDFFEAAVEALQAEHGKGPVRTRGRGHVLLART